MIKITPLPTPPTTNDTASFDIRADAFVEALPQFGEEANALADEINALCERTPQQLEQILTEGKAALEEVKNTHNAQLEAQINSSLEKINACSALKSDQFANLCNYILFSLQNYEHKLIKQQEYQAKMGHHAYFFRDSLPQGYAPAGSMLLIADYPLAYEYFKNAHKNAQFNCPLGYFALPQPNLYIKGTNDPAMVGRFEEEGLPDVQMGDFIKNISTSNRSAGTGGSTAHSISFSKSPITLSKSNPIYGRTQSVEVAHNCLLEGYFVGFRGGGGAK